MIAAESFVELLKSGPHWAFELSVELVTFAAFTLPFKWWIKRHDRKHHHGHTDSPPNLVAKFYKADEAPSVDPTIEEVSGEGYARKPVDGLRDVLRTQGGLNLIDRSNVGYRRAGRLLPDGRVLDLVELAFRGMLTVSATADTHEYGDAYTYASEAEATVVFCLWDGEGEPQGWTRYRRYVNGRIEAEEIR